MSDMIPVFAGIGLFVILAFIIISITALMSYTCDDDNHTAVWLITSLCYALTVTIFIMRSVG